MEKNSKKGVYEADKAGCLVTPLRKLFQHPRRILKPYITPGMRILDLGCGPGFFTKELAKLTGPSGRIVAADLQEGMLEITEKKIKKYNLGDKVELWKCSENSTGLAGKFDFILIFYVFHELPDKPGFLNEVHSLLNQDGKILLVEPQFHISKIEFEELKEKLKAKRFVIIDEPKIFLSHALLLGKPGVD